MTISDSAIDHPALWTSPAGTLRFAERWYAEGWYAQHTVPSRVIEGAARNGSCRLAFWHVDRVDRWTVAEIDVAVRAVAGGLNGLGIGRGDVVALHLPTSSEAIVAFLAIIAVGAVCLPVPSSAGPRELGVILRDAGAGSIIGSSSWRAGNYREELAGVGLNHVILVGDVSSGGISWSSLRVSAEMSAPAPGIAPDDVCLIVYTSGTTGRPKGVMHSHNSLLAEVDQLLLLDNGSYGYGPYLEQFPFGHMAGVLGALRPFIHGVDTHYLGKWDAERAAQICEAEGIAATSGTPFFLSELLRVGRERRTSFPQLRSYTIGAAPVPPELIAEAAAAGIDCMPSYGLSEQITVTGSAMADPAEARAASDGRLLPGRHIRIVDDAGLDLPDGELGEILVIGPEQFVGYRDQAQNAAAFDAEGWLRTGDIGRLDGDRLKVVDRKKDIIIRAGENISSVEVELAALGHPGVAGVAAIGAPDSSYGERICVFLVLYPGAEPPTPATFKAHFETLGLSRRKTPELVRIVSDFPLTVTGKVRKDVLRSMLINEMQSGVRA